MRLFLGLFCIGHDLIFLRTSHSVPYYSSLNLRSIYRPLVSVSQTGRTQTCSDAFSTSEKYVYKYLNIFMSQTGFGQAAESQHQQRSIERERERDQIKPSKNPSWSIYLLLSVWFLSSSSSSQPYIMEITHYIVYTFCTYIQWQPRPERKCGVSGNSGS